MNSEILILILTNIFSGLSTGTISYIFTLRFVRKQAKAQATGSEIDNVGKTIDIYLKLVQELGLKQDEHSKEIAAIKKNICLRLKCKNRIFIEEPETTPTA